MFAQRSKHSIFHNIFKYVVFQKRQKALIEMSGISGISIQIRIGKRLSDITIVEVVQNE